MNVFRPVNDSILFEDRIYQGQSWGNICFSRNASIKDYQDKGLYLEVSNKPLYNKQYDDIVVQETIDHINKKVYLVWDKVKKTDKKLQLIQDAEYNKIINKESRALSIASCIQKRLLPEDYTDTQVSEEGI